jgi:hypothetical protein
MARAVDFLRRQAERRIFSEHPGWAEGSCVTSRRFHEAILRVIVSPSWGPALCHGRSGYQFDLLNLNVDMNMVYLGKEPLKLLNILLFCILLYELFFFHFYL